jgi:hypothetical protein
VSLFLLVGLLSSAAGSGLVVLASLSLLIFAIVALVRASRAGYGTARSQKVPIALLAAALVLFMSGTASAAGHSGRSMVADGPSTQTERRAFVDSSESASPTPTPTPTPTVEITTERVEVTEPIPYTSSNVDDPAMDKGTTRVATVGVDGVYTKVYEVTKEDGVEVSRSLVEEKTSVEVINEVVAVGSKEAVVVPPPAPEPAGDCDSNYADACVPIASDVDCAGGSGNGPAYVNGPVRIVGSDVYDLDRDGDGIACD